MEIIYITDHNIVGIVEYQRDPESKKICVDKHILKHVLDACDKDQVTLEIIETASDHRVLGIKSGTEQNPKLMPVIAEVTIYEEKDEFVDNLLGDGFFGFKRKEM